MTIKQRIIDESLVLLQQGDPGEVTVQKICAACKITRPTFYKYFKNKDELLTYFYKNIADRILQGMINIVREETHVEQLWYIFDRYLHYTEEFGPQFLTEVLIANLREKSDTFEIITELSDAAAVMIEKAFEKGQIRNSAEPKGLYQALCRNFDGCLQYWCSRPYKSNLRNDVRKGFEWILNVPIEYSRIAQA